MEFDLFFERALWAIFAPNFDRWLPHLRQVNCGATFLFGTKLASQIALAGQVLFCDGGAHKMSNV